MITKHCLISGRVQGVSFRHYTQQEAIRLGLYGWAYNLPDGRVSVLASGDPDAVANLCLWLQHGPRLAHVEDCDCVTVQALEWENEFITGNTTLAQLEQKLGIALREVA